MGKVNQTMSRPTAVIGIDLSLTKTGICIFEMLNGEVVSYGTCSFKESKIFKQECLPVRAKNVAFSILKAVCERLKVGGYSGIDNIIIEVTPVMKNPDTSLKLYYLAGYMTAYFSELLQQVNIEIVPVTTVRKTIGCKNKKEAVLPRIRELMDESQHEHLDTLNNDEVDAIALCLYHVFKTEETRLNGLNSSEETV